MFLFCSLHSLFPLFRHFLASQTISQITSTLFSLFLASHATLSARANICTKSKAFSETSANVHSSLLFSLFLFLSLSLSLKPHSLTANLIILLTVQQSEFSARNPRIWWFCDTRIVSG